MEIKKGSHIHLIGICGTAMASLAGILKDKGFKITGSDLNPYPPMSTQLESLGIQILKGYKKENLNPRPDFVIVGNVVSANNEEALEMLRLRIPYTSLPKAMGEFVISERDCICISGTHGKTTTTSMMAWIAENMKLGPGFLIGGIAKNFSKSFQNPKGKYFIIEGDEYDTAYFDKVPKFVHYRPKHVIFTSCEFDHADIYKDLGAVKAAFKTLMELIPENGTLLACASERNVMELVKFCGSKNVFSYGIGIGDYQASIVKISENGTEFDVNFKGQNLGRYSVSLTGNYNILNTLAVIGMAHQLKWDLQNLSQALKSFTGVKRRQEILGEPGGVLVIEDFAHHPTAVRETVKGIKDRYPQRKVFAIFEPRSATSRRKVFQKEYAEAFKDCDEILLAKAFDQTKIDEGNRFSSEELVSDLVKSGKSAAAFDNVDQIVSSVKMKAHKGDLVLIMSNGGFDGIYQKILKELS